MKINSLRHSPVAVLAGIVALGLAGGLTFHAYRNFQLPESNSVGTPPIAALATPDNPAIASPIRFLENRVKQDPADFSAYNKLAAYYLQLLRETGNIAYLDLTLRAAHSSLAVVPANQNTGALAALAQAEYASHNFVAARDHALQLIKLTPNRNSSYQLLGDVRLELGDYDPAIAAFHQMERFSRGLTLGTETRQARLAMLRGEVKVAQRHFSNALALTLNSPVPPPETVAWCYWQLGETAFAIGDYQTAEQHYHAALSAFPGYFNALASLGRVRAAQGDLSGAIGRYEAAVLRLPDPTFVAALGDLYQMTGQEKKAAQQYALVEQIGHLSTVNGALYNRQLALFYADHDLNTEVAYANAKGEYAVRRDIYGADAVAWTALKAGKLDEAQAAMNQALRLGTQDAKLFYHAGMIAHAAGHQAAARNYLQRALAINPQFDPLQALMAQKTIAK
ncbi:MAG: tetratricopeptide repeat protein [Stenomitos rutilans HA7619-LM2]|jgi:tetratricopeptide (TPR) repeat protein|nr:tetratricopeptide repeat protein [Stenomitos rutilans HA7619-LM2]